MFYGIVGTNGFGVYDNKEKMDVSAYYLTKSSTMKFDELYKAFTWAVEEYNQHQTNTDDPVNNAFYGSLSDIKINWLNFRKKIYDENIKKYL